MLRPGDDGVDAYRLLTALVVPRPIAWVSSLSADGIGNLAPHSFFGVAGVDPPIVTLTSVGHKDTLRNVRETGEFVINLVTEAQFADANNTAARFSPDVDEAAALGIGMEPSETVAPRRVAGSPASIECVLHSVHEFGRSALVLGEVRAFTVRSEALVDGHPDSAFLRPLSRLGRDEWGLPPAVVRRKRPLSPDDIA